MSEEPIYTDLSTADQHGKRRWIFPIPAFGPWHRARKILAYVLIGWLLFAPWIKVGGNQAVFFDLVQRKIHFLGLTFWVNEMIVFMLFTLTILVGIVFLTAILGRVFCGWACPLTVFMEFVFRPIERLLEGFGAQQKAFRNRPLAQRWVPFLTKWTLFALIAFILANTFVAYFMGSHRLFDMMREGPLNHWGPFVFMMISFGIILFQYGWFREQICLFVCPYGRLQSVLLDQDSLIVAYDKNRGEPRGKKGTTTGDCIDCKLCVNVCPTGIDIRKGLQLECIHCTQCIDACDSIMQRIDRPLGLIRYQTQAEVDGQRRRFLRPRLAIYSFVFLGITSALLAVTATRSDFKATLHRETSTEVYSLDADDRVINPIRIHFSNFRDQPLDLSFSALEPPSLEVVVPEGPIQLKPNQKTTVHVILKLPRSEFKEDFGLKLVRFKAQTSEESSKIFELKAVGPAN